MLRTIATLVAAGALLAANSLQTRASAAPPPVGGGAVSILAYHRFESTIHDSMAVKTSAFAAQLRYLADHHYQVIPLRALVSSLIDGKPLSNAVVISVDDGHRSVYTDMLPLVREYRVPVTVFIYPSAISNASYAMTWREVDALRQTGLFDVQSHTYWHPNFKVERRRLVPSSYDEFVTTQLVKPRRVLQAKLGVEARLLAWPFGIYDDDLIRRASAAGYTGGVTLDARLVRAGDRPLALPRFLVTDAMSSKRFASILPAETQSGRETRRRLK